LAIELANEKTRWAEEEREEIRQLRQRNTKLTEKVVELNLKLIKNNFSNFSGQSSPGKLEKDIQTCAQPAFIPIPPFSSIRKKISPIYWNHTTSNNSSRGKGSAH